MRVLLSAGAMGLALSLAMCCCPAPEDPCAMRVLAAPQEVEEPVSLSAVPEHVLAAGRAAKPGILFEEAVREVENGVVVYELEGEVEGEDWVVEVTADGRVLDVEREEDDGRSAKSERSAKGHKSDKDDKSAKSGT